jgi:hypothetical protein
MARRQVLPRPLPRRKPGLTLGRREGPLFNPGRREDRRRRRGQARLSQADPAVSPRQEPRRQEGRGPLQGGLLRLRGAQRRRQAQELRRVRRHQPDPGLRRRARPRLRQRDPRRRPSRAPRRRARRGGLRRELVLERRRRPRHLSSTTSCPSCSAAAASSTRSRPAAADAPGQPARPRHRGRDHDRLHRHAARQRRPLRIESQSGGGRTLDVKVPAGIADGGKLRLRGQGGAGDPAGDILLTVRVAPHPRLKRDGLTPQSTSRSPPSRPTAAAPSTSRPRAARPSPSSSSPAARTARPCASRARASPRAARSRATC